MTSFHSGAAKTFVAYLSWSFDRRADGQCLLRAGSFPFWRHEDDGLAAHDPASRLRCMCYRIVGADYDVPSYLSGDCRRLLARMLVRVGSPLSTALSTHQKRSLCCMGAESEHVEVASVCISPSARASVAAC